MDHIDEFHEAAETVVDLSADFRLDTEAAYDEWYDGHSSPEYLDTAVYALPELTREELPGADLIAAGGCNATATLLGLSPLFDAGILFGSEQIVVDVKVGSSEGGATPSKASSHVERSGIVRPYAPTSHRHEAEIEEILGTSVSFTAHAVDMVRGASATCHVFPDSPVSKGDLWKAYRDAYEDEPFVRLVAGGGGVYRYPEPKAVAGTNYAEVGFELDPTNERIVVFSAIDNLMKGSAGQAVHAANVALGFEETAGLEFRGIASRGKPMTDEYSHEELLAAHDQLIDNDNDDGLVTDGGVVEDDDAPVVVKIGGARAVDPDGALSDVAHLTANGQDVVVVHGGSTAVDETLHALGEEPEYVESTSGVMGRFTDEKAMEVFEMVMPGKLNTELTASLQGEGVRAVGLSGVDGALLTGARKSAVRVVENGKRKIRRGDHSGKIESVNAELLETLLDWWLHASRDGSHAGRRRNAGQRGCRPCGGGGRRRTRRRTRRPDGRTRSPLGPRGRDDAHRAGGHAERDGEREIGRGRVHDEESHGRHGSARRRC